MTLKELNFFYKLCENPIVSQVAKELDISQSAISIAMKSLENKLEEDLFDRIGKKLILNERGRYFKEKTYKHFVALNDAQTIFKKNKIAGKLKIAASKTIANFIMPNVYYNFISKYPNVNLETDSINSSIIIKKILEGKLDLGLIEAKCDEINIIKESLCNDELIVVTSDKSTPKKAYIDAINKRWILREKGSGTRDCFIDHIGKISEELDIFMELHEFNEIKKILLEHKNTVTAMSKVAVEEEIKRKELFEIKLINIDLKREFILIYNKNKIQNNLFKLFKDFIKTNIKEKKF